MSPEDRAIKDFIERPTQESLLPLLRAVRDPVYNLCFQVLRRREDAEDAAQEVLVEIAREARQIRDGRFFRRWLYKVCLNTSLDHFRTRRRRLEVESKKPDPPPAPVNGEALIEALARLDDSDRALLVEHYFEGASLSEMAGREGCSKVAVWKRLEKARKKLKRSLSVSGLGLGGLLLAVPAVPAPSTLIARSLDKAALAFVGGLAVQSKTGVSIAILVLALLLLGVGLFGVGVFRKSDSPVAPGPVPSLAKAPADDVAPAEPAVVTPAPAEPIPAAPDKPSKAAQAAELKIRLARFRAWRLKANEEFKSSFTDQGGWRVLSKWEDMKRWKAAHMEELAGVRDLVKAAPEAFLEFVNDPANEECLPDLLDFTVANTWLSDGVECVARMKYSEAPPGLVDGLHERLLTAGTQAQLALLTFFHALRDDDEKIAGLPEKYLDHYRQLLATGEPPVKAIASIVMCIDPRLRADDLTSIQGLISKPGFDAWNGRLIEALKGAESPDVEEWFLGQIESNPDDHFRGLLVEAMGRRADFGQANPANLKRLAHSIETMMTRPQDVWNQWYILGATVHLPEESMLQVLERLEQNPAKKIIKSTAQGLIEKIRSGKYERKALGELVFKGRMQTWLWSQPDSK